MNRLILIALLATGCGSVELGGLAASDRLAIEHQRAHVATVFAIAKPYELVSADGKADDYVGPIRQAATIINDPQPTPELAPLSPPPPAEPKESTVAHEAPAVEWLDWDAALQLSSVTTRPVLVFQHYAEDEPFEFKPATMVALNKLGILCSDTAERWQPGVEKPVAPAVAYVRPSDADGTEPPFNNAPRVDDESALLQQLKAWINAIETP